MWVQLRAGEHCLPQHKGGGASLGPRPVCTVILLEMRERNCILFEQQHIDGRQRNLLILKEYVLDNNNKITMLFLYNPFYVSGIILVYYVY